MKYYELTTNTHHHHGFDSQRLGRLYLRHKNERHTHKWHTLSGTFLAQTDTYIMTMYHISPFGTYGYISHTYII